MASETDWLGAAEGVPRHPGARVWTASLAGGRHLARVTDGGNIRMVLSGVVYPPAAEVLDLSDARTQRAYLGDLALALGAPPAAVEEGVRFYPWTGGWRIDAGAPVLTGYAAAWEMDLRDLGTTDRMTALARAWPADRRNR